MNEQLIGDLFAEATRRMTGSSSREFSQKFAELIVRECAEVFWSEACNMSDLAYEEYYRNSMKVKRHFGVEL